MVFCDQCNNNGVAPTLSYYYIVLVAMMNMKLNVKENLNLLGAPDRQQSRIRRGLEDLLTTGTNGRNENYVEAFPWRQAFILEIESQVRVQTI